MQKLERDIGIEKPASGGVHVHMKTHNASSQPSFTGLTAGYKQYDQISAGLGNNVLMRNIMCEFKYADSCICFLESLLIKRGK